LSKSVSGVIKQTQLVKSLIERMSSQRKPLLPRDLDVEEAETANIESLEQGHQPTGLGSGSSVNAAASTIKSKFRLGVRKAMMAQKLSQTKRATAGPHQRRRNSMAAEMLGHLADPAVTHESASNNKNKHISHADRQADEDIYSFPTSLFHGSTDSEDMDSSSPDLLQSQTHYGTSTIHRSRSISRSNRARRQGWTMTAVKFLVRAIVRSTLLWIALPSAVAALVFYYPLGNPVVDFLPGTVTLAWWFNFVARQAVTLELARMTQYLFIDRMLIRSGWNRIQLCSFIAYHICGWPFILIAWGTIDLFVLHGNNRFQVHWLWWTKWTIYSNQANSGAHILSSELYLRLLLSMIFLGCATAIKRCLLELRFSGRLFANFKPRLEQILKVRTEVVARGLLVAKCLISSSSCCRKSFLFRRWQPWEMKPIASSI
jgi:hypothetical protein